jgi:hypothetical protein
MRQKNSLKFLLHLNNNGIEKKEGNVKENMKKWKPTVNEKGTYVILYDTMMLRNLNEEVGEFLRSRYSKSQRELERTRARHRRMKNKSN